MRNVHIVQTSVLILQPKVSSIKNTEWPHCGLQADDRSLCINNHTKYRNRMDKSKCTCKFYSQLAFYPLEI